MSFLKRARPQLPTEVLRDLELPHGERVLASAVDQRTGAHVIATNWHLVVVPARGERVVRGWDEVDAGQWETQTWTLTVTWVGGGRPGQWTFGPQDTRLPEVFHERVRASIVLVEELALPKPAAGRVVVRRDLQDGRIFVQTVLNRAAKGDDPVVRREVARARADVAEQVGL